MSVILTDPAAIELAYSGFVQSFGNNLTAGTLGVVLYVFLSAVNIAIYYTDIIVHHTIIDTGANRKTP